MSEAPADAFEPSEAMEILTRTPVVLRALLAGLSPGWTEAPDTPEGWNARVVLGHLIHGEETDWIPRLRIILTEGLERPFDPYDREAQFHRFGDWTIPRLLDRFAEIREANLRYLRELDLGPDLLARVGTHPELGPTTAAQLLATWAVHDLSHLAQIARAMTRRYRTAVGPWAAYLSLVKGT